MKNKLNNTKILFYFIFKDLFYLSLIVFGFYVILESLFPGIVVDYFNLNFLIFSALVSGTLMTLFFNE